MSPAELKRAFEAAAIFGQQYGERDREAVSAWNFLVGYIFGIDQTDVPLSSSFEHWKR